MPPSGNKGILLTNKKRVILALRLLILALLVLISFLNRTRDQIPVQVYFFLAIYITTLVASAFLDLRNFLTVRASTWIFVFDVLVTLVISFYLGQKNPEFYVVYMVAVLAAAAGKNTWVVFATTLVVTVIYGIFSSMGRTGVELFSTTFFIHIILFYIMAVFSTYLIHEAELERREKELTRHKLTTEMDHLAEHLENVLQSINIGIMIMDNSEKITTLNRRAEDILKVSSDDLLHHEVGQLPLLSGFLPFFQDKTDTTRMARTVASKEFNYTRPDGSVATLGLSLARLKDRNGIASGTICCFQDITVIREIEQRMSQQERLSTVAQLASGMAHEFYNLLGGVQGLLDMAAKERNLDEVQEAIQLSSQTLKRVFHLIQNLLAFSREQEPSRGPCRINDILEETLALVQHELKKSSIEVVKRYGTLPELMGDAHQLGQVFMNLIINARHAMAEGGTLTISTGGHGREVVVTVAATGCGITPEHMEKIFVPFFTTKGALGGSKVPGTGLGLTVSRAIIEKHGGMITVRSDVRKGTTFTIRLPVESR